MRLSRDDLGWIAAMSAVAMWAVAILVASAVGWLPDAHAEPRQAGCDQDTYYVTGYTSIEFPGLTADGTPTRGNEWSIAAVDPRVIPMNSTILVHTIGYFRAADHGGGVIGRHIDLLVHTRQQAYNLTGCYSVEWW